MAKLEEVSQVKLQLDTKDIIEILGNIDLLTESVGYSKETPERTEEDLMEMIRSLKDTLEYYYKADFGTHIEASSTISISETTL